MKHAALRHVIDNPTALAEAKLPTPERTLKHAALRHVIDNLTALAEAKLPTPERTLNHDELCVFGNFSAKLLHPALQSWYN